MDKQTPGFEKSMKHGSEVYYQNFADLIRLWWELNVIRMNSNEMSFIGSDTIATKEDYVIAIKSSLVSSWKSFIADDLTEAYPAFGSRFVQDLKDEICTQGLLYSKKTLIKHRFTLEEWGDKGITSAVDISAQLATQVEDPVHATFLTSTVDLIHEGDIRHELGLKVPDSKVCPRYGEARKGNLYDSSYRSGLDEARLKQLGMGRVTGCPASMPPSIQTRNYLLDECNVPTVTQTTVHHLARRISDIVPSHIARKDSAITTAERYTVSHISI